MVVAALAASSLLFATSDVIRLNAEASRLLAQDAPQKALPLLKKAVALAPENSAIQFNYGLALSRSGQLLESLVPLAAALADPVVAPGARYLRGVAFFHLNELPDAITELAYVRAHAEHGEGALYMLTESYRRIGRIDESQQAFVELTTRYPDSAYGYKLMGMAHDSARRFDEAIEAFQAALRVNPALPEIRFAIGFAYWKKRHFDSASAWLGKELDLNPCYTSALYYLGDIERERNNTAAALDWFTRALACDPRHLESLVARGALLEELGEAATALVMFEKAVLHHPSSIAARYRLGRALHNAGRPAEARRQFDAVKKLQASQ